MAWFKSKQQKEIEKKMLIKRTINTMNKQINRLEDQKQVFIDAAKRAKLKGLDAQFNLALSGYKMTVQQQKRAQEMLLNFEITAQMKDVTMMTSEFLRGMSDISKEMTKLADAKEFAKILRPGDVVSLNGDLGAGTARHRFGGQGELNGRGQRAARAAEQKRGDEECGYSMLGFHEQGLLSKMIRRKRRSARINLIFHLYHTANSRRTQEISLFCQKRSDKNKLRAAAIASAGLFAGGARVTMKHECKRGGKRPWNRALNA